MSMNMNKKKGLFKALAPLGVLTLVLSGCTGGSTTPQAEPGNETLRVNWGGFPDSWAPGSQSTQPGHMRVPYETLVLREPNGKILPNLATEWEFAERSTALTLKLRDDVTFHDGTKFNAQAVAANVDYVSNVVGGQFGAPLKAGVASVEAVDEYTVKFNFTRPYSTFLDLMSQRNLPIASPAAIADGSITTRPIGTGPWKFDETKSIQGTKLFFGKFDQYWGEQPAFPNIELYAIADDTAAIAGLLSGEIDVADVEPAGLPRLDAAPNAAHFNYPAVRNNVVFFDRAPGKVLGDVKARQALCLAMDATVVAEVGKGEAQNQHFLEGEPGHNPDIEGYSADLEEAKKLWAEIGNPELNLDWGAAAFNKQEITIRAEQMNQLPGVNVNVQELAQAQFISTWNSGRYPLGLGNHPQITPADWYNAWFSETAPGNPAKFTSPELKALAGQAQAASGTPDANGKWQAVMKQISDEALTCSHYVGPETIAYNTDTVADVKAAISVWEPLLIDYRTIRPAN